MNKDTLNHLLTFAAGLIMGVFLIYTSYMMISDTPEKKDLLWLSSADVTEIKYSSNKKNSRIQFYSNEGYCLSLSSKKDGFTDLYDTIKNGGKYSIGYNQERMLFSDKKTLYSKVYEISVNGKVIDSYESHVSAQRYLFLFIGGFGIFILMAPFYIYKNSTGNNSEGQETENQTSLTMIDALIAIIILTGVGFVANYLEDKNIPTEVTYSAIITLGFIAAFLYKRKELDRDRQIMGILTSLGLGVFFLSILVNAYMIAFFRLTVFHIALALVPAFVYSVWVSYRDKPKGMKRSEPD